MKTRVYDVIVRILTYLARKLLAKHKPKIVAVTGSVGKTSTKRAIAAAVETSFKTQWHDGNYNSDIGLPLALFEIKSPANTYNPFAWASVLFKAISKLLFWSYPYELLVLEYGIDHPGEMDGFLSLAIPEIGVVTAVHGSHLEGMGSVEMVYTEKTKLADFAKTALVNIDDELLRNRYVANHPKVKTYGHDKSASYNIAKVKRDEKTLKLSFNIDDHQINTNFVADYQVSALAAGWAVGRLLKIQPKTIIQGLEELEPYAGRMNALPGKKGSIVLDDSYNNVSTKSAKAALQTLADMPAKRRLLVFGTMNEMGDATEAGHREVGLFANELNFDYIVTIGGAARGYFADEMVAHGFDKEKISSFLSPYEAGEHLAPMLKKGDVILVKGSQNKVFSEETTALLLKLESDRSKLVRQSSSWQKKKHEQFN